jgi:TolB protein
LTDGAAVDLHPQWNVDGSSLVFERNEAARSRLFLLRLERERTRSCEALELCNRDARRVRGRVAFFAADVFAYVSDRGGRPAVWLADLEHRKIEPLTQPVQDEADFGPSTSPAAKGVFVFFRILGTHGRPHLFRGELRSGIQPLTIGSREGDQPWLFPAADRIVFHSRRDGDDAIFVRNIEPGSNARRLSDDDERTAFVTPYPSPSGEHVVFASARSGVSQLWLIRADGSGRQQLTFDAEPSAFPAWSPEGGRIAFVRGNPNASEPTGRLMMMKIATV